MSLQFGSELPTNWQWKKLSQLAEINPNAPKLSSDLRVSFVAMADVTESGHINPNGTRTCGEVKSGYTPFMEGDILLAKITPCFENGKGAIAKGLENGIGFGSTEFHVLRPRQGTDLGFLFIHTRTPEFRRYGEANMVGSAGQKRVPPSFVSDWRVPTPPLIEQRRIAAILSTWDESIRRVTRVSELLKSQYSAISAQHIRLRGNNMLPLGDLLLPDQMEPVAPNGPFRAMGVRSHGKGTFQRDEDLVALESGKTVYRVEPGRFVVNIVFAWEGAAAVTTEKDAGCLVSHRFPTFTINREHISVDYLRHLIRTDGFRRLLALASPGGAGRNKTLNRSDLLRFEIHVPSMMDQKPIADTLQVLDRKLTFNARYLDRLVSQRDALATELLTGRLRVSDVKERRA